MLNFNKNKLKKTTKKRTDYKNLPFTPLKYNI